MFSTPKVYNASNIFHLLAENIKYLCAYILEKQNRLQIIIYNISIHITQYIMKQQEAKRLAKVIESLQKIQNLMEEDKVARAKKAVASLTTKLQKRIANSETISKRKPSAYALFVKANYKSIAKQNPDASSTEVMQILAQLYRGSKVAVKAASPKKSPAKKESKKAASPKKSPAAKKARAPRKSKK